MSLAGWWLYFGITTLSKASEQVISSQLARHQKMLFMEGCVLLFSLLGGGLALFYFSYRMYKEKSAKEIFFASFTHDMKTALFRLQLELEKLNCDEVLREKLLGNTRKMQLDFENGLDSSVGQNKNLFLEEIDLKTFLLDLHAQWPEISIQIIGNPIIKADKKALYSIFKNLLHNSYLHGKADEVSVSVNQQNNRFVLDYKDNGQPFAGSLDDLGQATFYTSGGSGFGLYITQQWVKRLGGELKFQKSQTESLAISISLPGVAS